MNQKRRIHDGIVGAVVTAGVNDGERVVTLGVQKLLAGQRVRAVE